MRCVVCRCNQGGPFLGRAVQARRHEVELTQEMLANDTGLHQRWISNAETGKRNPSDAASQRDSASTPPKLIARAEQIECLG